LSHCFGRIQCNSGHLLPEFPVQKVMRQVDLASMQLLPSEKTLTTTAFLPEGCNGIL
jgi:hypothetical protein